MFPNKLIILITKIGLNSLKTAKFIREECPWYDIEIE